MPEEEQGANVNSAPGLANHAWSLRDRDLIVIIERFLIGHISGDSSSVCCAAMGWVDRWGVPGESRGCCALTLAG